MGKTKIWIAGAEGGLGSTILYMISKLDYNVVATDKDVDVTDMESVSSFADICRPDVVINCTGYYNKSEEKEEVLTAYRTNAIGARNLAAATRKNKTKLIHISSDDVFSGKHKAELTEFDLTVPITTYGKSKLAGENFVRELNPKHLIVRSSWVYGKKGNNFVKDILEKAKNGEKLMVPNDQISTPTSAKELALFVIKMIDSKEYGIYHASCEGNTTRFHFANTILKLKGYNDITVEPVFAEGSHGSFTVLQNLMMEMTGIHRMADWEDALKEFLLN